MAAKSKDRKWGPLAGGILGFFYGLGSGFVSGVASGFVKGGTTGVKGGHTLYAALVTGGGSTSGDMLLIQIAAIILSPLAYPLTILAGLIGGALGGAAVCGVAGAAIGAVEGATIGADTGNPEDYAIERWHQNFNGKDDQPGIFATLSDEAVERVKRSEQEAEAEATAQPTGNAPTLYSDMAEKIQQGKVPTAAAAAAAAVPEKEAVQQKATNPSNNPEPHKARKPPQSKGFKAYQKSMREKLRKAEAKAEAEADVQTSPTNQSL